MPVNKNKNIRRVPIVAVRGAVIFPHTDNVLSFGRAKSVAAINTAFREDRVIAIFTQKDNKVVDPGHEDLHKVGTVATITQMMTTDGDIHAMIRGQARIRLEDILEDEPFMVGKVTEIGEIVEDENEVKALSKQLVEVFKKAVNLGFQAEIMTVMGIVSGNVSGAELADQVVSVLDLKIQEKQKLLEETDVAKRLTKILDILSREVSVLEIEKSISVKTQKKFEDQMRKAMLREKKKTIEEELGEEDEEGNEDVRMYRKKIRSSGMPKDVKLKAKKELKRLSLMSPNNPENAYIRNYLDWLTDMPWDKYSPNNVSIIKAAKVLKDEHYGLEKAKERILEYLAVMKIKGKDKKKKKDVTLTHPTILCFMGPPGVGKTSIGRSIAKSMGREFIRISLGGIRDEAEIRGHRRTYVGALPGRIIQGIKNAGTSNPVFMLDEIDKIGTDFRGDPSSALLEALDPEQNREFSDHYLEVPYDLSNVMFICTGNVVEDIPGPLMDRMEIINFPGYTQDEKFNIAKNFIWKKQLKLHGLDKKKIKITNGALNEIIVRYTREAGVRNLERMIATIMRKIARLIAEGKKYPKNINLKDVRTFLGAQRFSQLAAEKKDEVGIATGLAVTAAGGEIIMVEVALMPGKGKLLLTGQLGDVMKESAKAAFTWAKSHWKELGLKRDFARDLDVHIHVPEGAVPKDGPSAGITMTTALVSALTGVKAKRDVGMTGEITLRGRVLPIGGVKEKVIAGHRAGLKTIILPIENKKDMEDVPKEVKKDVKFVFARRYDEVVKIALNGWRKPKKMKNSRRYSSPAALG